MSLCHSVSDLTLPQQKEQKEHKNPDYLALSFLFARPSVIMPVITLPVKK